MSRIGLPQRIIVVEPLQIPVPTRDPVKAPELPAPVPERVPA